jgi:soluble lytic murein transglycosylase
MKRYNNSIELTAAAYHGGFGAVDGWLEKGIVKKDAFRIEDIPKENDMTAEYVRRIKKAYSKYQEVLKEKKIIEN